jgi:hypothetical protein
MGLAAFQTSPPIIRTDDVDRFFAVYEKASGSPTSEALQSGYLDLASSGVRQFIPNRIVSADNLAQQIKTRPEIYRDAKACAQDLDVVRERVESAYASFKGVYPNASAPQITVLIGGGNSGGTVGDAGVLIGLEVVCQSNHLQPDVKDRLTHLIAHEMIHVEQGRLQPASTRNVLNNSLREGVADFIGELISGQVSNVHLHRWNTGHEAEIARRFREDADKADLSAWLYNGVGTPEAPGDQGYWAGYQVAKAYYDRATDKSSAIGELLAQRDAKAILDESGWGG